MTTLLIIIFVLGYAGIASEHLIRINKAATALITGVLCWVIHIISSGDKQGQNDKLVRIADIPIAE